MERGSRRAEEEQEGRRGRMFDWTGWTGNGVKDEEGQMGQLVKEPVVGETQPIVFEPHKPEQQSPIREGSSVLQTPDTSSNTGTDVQAS